MNSTISIDRDYFLEKISLASHFTSSRLSSVAALQGVLIKGEAGGMHLYATNLNSYYHTNIKTENKTPFQVILEPKKIIEFLSLLSPGKITIEIKEKQVVIIQQKTRGAFPIISSEEFPLPPKIDEKEKKIKTANFIKGLPLVLFAASTDETRPVLSGVNFLTQDEEMIMVATDGFRLSLQKYKKDDGIGSMIIPSGFLSEILKFIKGEEVFFGHSTAEKTILFRVSDDEFFSRLIEGDYPPFEKVIPIETKTIVVADREELLRKVKLISVFARDLSHIVVIEITKEGIRLQPKTETNDGNVAQQEAEVSGEDQRAAFNYKFVLDILNHISSKKIKIELVRSDAPVVFKSEGDESFLHIIMPVRIQE